MDERDSEDIDDLLRSHTDGDITIRQITRFAEFSYDNAAELVESTDVNLLSMPTRFHRRQTPQPPQHGRFVRDVSGERVSRN